jgi:hypothetical protein
MAITALPTPPSRSDPVNFADRGDAFLGALPTFVTEANALATATNQNEINAELAETNAETAQAAAEAARDLALTYKNNALTSANNADTSEANALASEVAAAASAASAAAIAGAFVSTSTTTWTPTIGSQAFAVQTGEQYTAGIFVTVVSASLTSNWGFGQVTSYSGSTLTVDIQVISGSTSKSDWNISLTGSRGATGAAGTGVTPQTTGFTLTGGTTTSKTLTVVDTLSTSDLVKTSDIGTTVQGYDSDLTTWAGKTAPSGTVVGTSDTQTLSAKTLTGLKETKTTSSSNNFDLSAANYFTHTVSGATTFTVSNVATTGSVNTIILDLTNGGSAAITWWSGVKWAAGTAPTLTSAGRDALGFFTHDGGTTWSGLVLAKDIK